MPDSHPSVIFIDADTRSPRVAEQICYPDEQAAFDAMCDYQPYLNTKLVPKRCDQVHCPNGCVSGEARQRPTLQQPARDDPADRPADATRWRCPKCHTEYTRGELPGMPAAQLAAELSAIGLADVRVSRYGSWPVVVSGVFPPGPGVYTEEEVEMGHSAVGWVVRVAEQVGRAISSTPGRLTEPYWMGLFRPDARDWVADPVQQWERLTLPQVLARIRVYM